MSVELAIIFSEVNRMHCGIFCIMIYLKYSLKSHFQALRREVNFFFLGLASPTYLLSYLIQFECHMSQRGHLYLEIDPLITGHTHTIQEGSGVTDTKKIQE